MLSGPLALSSLQPRKTRPNASRSCAVDAVTFYSPKYWVYYAGEKETSTGAPLPPLLRLLSTTVSRLIAMTFVKNASTPSLTTRC